MISNLSHVDGLSFMRLPTCSKLSKHRFGNHPRLNWTKQTYFHLAHHRVSLGGCEVVTKPIHAHCTIFHCTAPSLPQGAQPTSYNLAIWNSKASIQTVGDVGACPFSTPIIWKSTIVRWFSQLCPSLAIEFDMMLL